MPIAEMSLAEMPGPVLALLPLIGAAILAYLMSDHQRLLSRALPARLGALPCLACVAAGIYCCIAAYGPAAGLLAAAIAFMLSSVALPYLVSLRGRS